MMVRFSSLAAFWFVPIVLIACGGGGGNNEESAKSVTEVQDICNGPEKLNLNQKIYGLLTKNEGFYKGETDAGQKIFILVLDNNHFYAFYKTPDSLRIGKVLQGSVKLSDDGVMYGWNGISYDFDNAIKGSALIYTHLTPKGSLNGSLLHLAGSRQRVSFTAQYDASYAKPPTIAAIAAGYRGGVAMEATGRGGSLVYAFVSVAAPGYVAFDSDLCKAEGTIAPRTSGNVYSLTLNFDSSMSCAYANQTLSGIMVLTEDSKVLMFARASDTSHPLLFLGNKMAIPVDWSSDSN